MRRRVGRTVAAFLIIALAQGLGGCWNRREVNEVALVSAAAIDRAPGGQLRVTVQIVHPSAISQERPKATTGTGARAVFTVSAEGATVAEALDRVNHQLPRPAGWEHNNAIIFSEEVARAGVADLLDYFVRDRASRLDQWILVSRGEAASILQGVVELYPNTGIGLRRMYQQIWTATGQAAAARLHEVLFSVFSPTTSPIVGAVEPLRPEEESDEADARRPRLRIGGAAVFKGDRLAGWLTDREARGVQWLRGKVVHANITVPCRGEGRGINVEVVNSNARLVPQWPAGGTPAVRVPVRVTVRLESVMCREDLSTPEAVKGLARRTETVIEAEAEEGLRRVQADLGADSIGVGEALYRAYPRQFPAWEARWDQFYRELRVMPAVQVEFSQTGTTMGKPIPREKAGGGE